MSDFIRFILILFFGFSVSFMFFFFTCFPSFSPASRQRATRFSYFIMIPTVLIAFVFSHMFDHVLHFVEFLVTF